MPKREYIFGSTDSTWFQSLLDSSSLHDPINVGEAINVYMIFTKPDGTKFPTDKQMIDGFVQDGVEVGGNPALGDIIFKNLELPSFIDQRGPWEVLCAATFPDQLIKNIESEFFFVK